MARAAEAQLAPRLGAVGAPVHRGGAYAVGKAVAADVRLEPRRACRWPGRFPPRPRATAGPGRQRQNAKHAAEATHFSLGSCRFSSGARYFPLRICFTMSVSASAALFTSAKRSLSLSRSAWLVAYG